MVVVVDLLRYPEAGGSLRSALIQALATCVQAAMMKRPMTDRHPPDDAAILPFPAAEERAPVDRAALERDEETALLVKVREHNDRAAFRRLFELLALSLSNQHL